MEKNSAILLAVVGAWLYFTGWAYLYSFFGFFSINLIEIDPSIQFVLMHSLTPWYFWLTHLIDQFDFDTFVVLVGLYGGIITIIIVLLGIPSVARRADQLVAACDSCYSRLCPYFSSSTVLASVLFILFIASLFASRSAGALRAEQIWSDPGTIVYFNVEKDVGGNQGFSDRTKHFNEDFRMKYLFSTSEFHYAIVRNDDCYAKVCGGFILKIPVRTVREVLIRRDGG